MLVNRYKDKKAGRNSSQPQRALARGRTGHFRSELLVGCCLFTFKSCQARCCNFDSFLARDVIYTSRAHGTMSVSVCL